MNIDTRTYQKRRTELMERMGEGVAIIPNAPRRRRNADVDYPHRAHSNFLYLTDFPEVTAVIVLIAGERPRSILFCAGGTQTPYDRFLLGPTMDPKTAAKKYGFDEAHPINELDERMEELLKKCRTLAYSVGDETSWDLRILQWVECAQKASFRKSERPVRNTLDLHNLIAEMRIIKSDEEIAMMQKVGDLTADAHILAMEACRPGMMEYELEALMAHHLRRYGCDPFGAYGAIVGGGVNGIILHYSANNSVLQGGDLVLIDFGGEYHGYSADITRTFPVNGKFSPAQRALYEIVLRAQKAAIDKMRPGNSFNDPHIAAQRILIEGLVDLGIMKGSVNKLLVKRLDPYCPFDDPARIHTLHNTGHLMGLDVHDVGDYVVDGKPRILQVGMVMTAEPGVYLRHENLPKKLKRYGGIGIRIEDDVLVTKDGPRVLSAGVPKEPKEIEALMRR